MKKPTPISKEVVCSVCGFDWKAHEAKAAKGKQPTLEVCVELLKMELSKRPSFKPYIQASSGTTPYWQPLGQTIN